MFFPPYRTSGNSHSHRIPSFSTGKNTSQAGGFSMALLNSLVQLERSLKRYVCVKGLFSEILLIIFFDLQGHSVRL